MSTSPTDEGLDHGRGVDHDHRRPASTAARISCAVGPAEPLDTAAVQGLARRLEGQGWVRRNDLTGRSAPLADAGQIEVKQVSHRGQVGTRYRSATR